MMEVFCPLFAQAMVSEGISRSRVLFVEDVRTDGFSGQREPPPEVPDH